MSYKNLSDDAVIRISDGVLVRLHPESPYFQEYQEWLDQGNTLEPADELYDTSFGIRAKRDALLAQSDWTQLSDVSLSNSDEWSIYRQKLRDLTSQPEFPDQIEWPVTPGT